MMSQLEPSAGGNGVCMMSTAWRDEQHPSFINFILCFLNANSFRLNIVPIAPVITLLSDFSFLELIRCSLLNALFVGFHF